MPAVDANRMYSLTDYCTLSTLRDAAIWPTTSHSESLQANRTVETSNGYVLVDALAGGMNTHNNLDLNMLRTMNEQQESTDQTENWDLSLS